METKLSMPKDSQKWTQWESVGENQSTLSQWQESPSGDTREWGSTAGAGLLPFRSSRRSSASQSQRSGMKYSPKVKYSPKEYRQSSNVSFGEGSLGTQPGEFLGNKQAELEEDYLHQKHINRKKQIVPMRKKSSRRSNSAGRLVVQKDYQGVNLITDASVGGNIDVGTLLRPKTTKNRLNTNRSISPRPVQFKLKNMNIESKYIAAKQKAEEYLGKLIQERQNSALLASKIRGIERKMVFKKDILKEVKKMKEDYEVLVVSYKNSENIREKQNEMINNLTAELNKVNQKNSGKSSALKIKKQHKYTNSTPTTALFKPLIHFIGSNTKKKKNKK